METTDVFLEDGVEVDVERGQTDKVTGPCSNWDVRP